MKRVVIVFGIILSAFVFSVSFATLYAQTHIIEGTACSCTLPIPLLIPTFSSFGLLVGLISFYLLNPKEQPKKEKSSNWIKLLDKDEAMIIEILIKNDGKISQAAISRKMGKVKAFRLLERLKRRGIIEKEKNRKTNEIKLTEEFKFLLSS